MTMALQRVSDRDLEAITTRRRSVLSEDGLRAWYPNDVDALLGEVISLRRIQANATAILSGPPLRDLPPGASILDVAEQLAAKWKEYDEGLWKTAEMRRLRERQQGTADRLAVAEREAAAQKATVEAMRTELDEATKAHEQLRHSEAARQQAEGRALDTERSYKQAVGEISELARQRDGLEANRQKLVIVCQELTDRLGRVEALGTQIMGVVRRES